MKPHLTEKRMKPHGVFHRKGFMNVYFTDLAIKKTNETVRNKKHPYFLLALK